MRNLNSLNSKKISTYNFLLDNDKIKKELDVFLIISNNFYI